MDTHLQTVPVNELGNLALIRPVVDRQKAIGLACSLYGLSISDPYVSERIS